MFSSINGRSSFDCMLARDKTKTQMLFTGEITFAFQIVGFKRIESILRRMKEKHAHISQ